MLILGGVDFGWAHAESLAQTVLILKPDYKYFLSTNIEPQKCSTNFISVGLLARLTEQARPSLSLPG